MSLSPKNWVILSIMTIVLFFQLSPTSGLKCDSLIKESSFGILSYLGNVTFNAPGPGPIAGNWALFMKTTAPFTFLGGWGVFVESDGSGSSAKFHNVDDDTQVKKGDEISFQFRIHYAPTASKIPHVKSLQWEKWTICEGTSKLERAPPTLTPIGKKGQGKILSRRRNRNTIKYFRRMSKN